MRWDRQNLFVIAGFVIAGFVSTYFIVILPGFKMLFAITGSSLQRGLLLRDAITECSELTFNLFNSCWCSSYSRNGKIWREVKSGPK